MRVRKTFIIAKDYNDFFRLCENLELDGGLSSVEYLDSRHHLMGRRFPAIIATERWHENPHYDQNFIDSLNLCCPLVLIEGTLAS